MNQNTSNTSSIQRFIVSRDDAIYEAFPDVALSPSGRLTCVFLECTSHGDRGYTRVMLTTSDDRGRSWTPKRPLSAPQRYSETSTFSWNCPRISTLPDGRLAVLCDHVNGIKHSTSPVQEIWIWFSDDEGETWSEPQLTPAHGIVPDQLIELRNGQFAGRWIFSATTTISMEAGEMLTQRCWISDDQGASWSGPHTVAADPVLKLCEGSFAELADGVLVCFLRENSMRGLDAFKVTSLDGGVT